MSFVQVTNKKMNIHNRTEKNPDMQYAIKIISNSFYDTLIKN